MPHPKPAQLPESADLVVVGGGVIGLSIAYEAGARGHTVVLVDKHACGGGATPVAAGMLAPVSEAEIALPEMVDLGLESCRMYPRFVERIETDSGMECGYRTEGTLTIALDRDQMAELEHRAAAHQALGLAAARLSGRAVRELEPALSPRTVGGLQTEIDRQVDPRALSAALAAAARRHGVVMAESTELSHVEYSDAGEVAAAVLVDTNGADGQRAVTTSDVVLCAGVWTRELAPEVSRLPLRPVKGQVVRLRGAVLINHVVATPDVYLVPRASGELVIGASVEEQGFDARTTAGVTMELLGQAWRALPSIYELEIGEMIAGFRPALSDHLPAIGALAPPGLHVATGHYRNGVMLAPITAKHVVDSMESGAYPETLAPFDPLRFARQGAPRASARSTAAVGSGADQ